MSQCIASVLAGASRYQQHGSRTHPMSHVRHRCGPPVGAIFQEDGDSVDCVFQES